MGDASMASSIEIRWPSGIVQTLNNVKGDRQVQVDEPTVGAAVASQPQK